MSASPHPFTRTVTKPVHSDITLVITSCGRHELLKRSIESMSAWVHKFGERIIVEDQPTNSATLELLRKQGWKIFINDSNLGQHASIDRAYHQVKTAFIFHSEDDWQFSRQPDFAIAKKIINGDSPLQISNAVSMVQYSNAAYRNWKLDSSAYGKCTIGNKEFRYSRLSRRAWHTFFKRPSTTKWQSFSFNPCLVKTELWHKHGPWYDFVRERSIATYMMNRGYVIVAEYPTIATHIGGGDHIHDSSRRRSNNFRRCVRQWIYKGVIN